MSMTSFAKKCEILGKVWVWYKDDDSRSDGWKSFFDWHDVGLPMAYLAMSDFVIIRPEKQHFIDETWNEFCKLIGIDPEVSYENVQEAFDAARGVQ